MTELNKITGIVVGQYGEAITLTITDDDGVAVDISAYTTTKKVLLRDPTTLVTKSYDATFTTDGTNGQINFTPATGDIDRPGEWEGQVELSTLTARVVTKIFTVIVEKRIGST